MSKNVKLSWNKIDNESIDKLHIHRHTESNYNINSYKIATVNINDVQYVDENVNDEVYYLITGEKDGEIVLQSDFYYVNPNDQSKESDSESCSCCKLVTRFFKTYKGNYYRFFNVVPKIPLEYKQYFKLTYFHRFIGQNHLLEEGAWMRVDEIDSVGTIVRTAYNKYIKSKQWMKEHAYLEPLVTTGHYYRGSIVTDGRSSNVEVDRVNVVKAGTNHPYVDDNNFARITSKGYVSALHLRTGLFGFEPYYGDSLKGVYDTSTKLFTNSLDIPVYEHGDGDVFGRHVTEYASTTGYIEVGKSDAAVIGNCILYGESGYRPKVTTMFYDENKSLIHSELHINHTTSVKEGENVFLEWITYRPHLLPEYPLLSEYQNKRHGNIRNKYGYSSMPAINNVLGIPPETRYVRYKFERNGGSYYYMAFPCADTIVPLAGKDGYISPVAFNFEIPSYDDYIIGIANIQEP